MSEYAMDPYLTCWENNRYSYSGYHDPTYAEDERYIASGGEGDVCDHTDPVFGGIRDTCYFQVQLGGGVWTYKCMHHNSCPKKNELGEGIMGCVNVTNKRITCCCNESDKCNGEKYQMYADLGYAENYVPSPGEDNSKGNTDTDTDTDAEGYGDGTGETQANYGRDTSTTASAITATSEVCVIQRLNSTECSCGGSCTALETEYFATVESKCGTQTLRTGQYGAEDCDPEDTLKEVGVAYNCLVLPCAEGEFRFDDSAHCLKISYGIIIFCIMLYVFGL